MTRGSSGCGFEYDAVSESFGLGGEAVGGVFGVAVAEVVATEVTVELAGLEHVPAYSSRLGGESATAAPCRCGG
jgi:hypothetical protein